MAIDSYMVFTDFQGTKLQAESLVVIEAQKGELTEAAGKFMDKGTVFEITDYNFDIEQTLNIGSQSSGTGAGRVTFNPFSITRKIDKASPVFFQMACSGTPFQEVCLGLRKSSGGDSSGRFFLMFRFMLVAVKTVSWAHDDESPNETVTFEYGGLQVFYGLQKQDGSIDSSSFKGGWNRVTNKAEQLPTAIIK